MSETRQATSMAEISLGENTNRHSLLGNEDGEQEQIPYGVPAVVRCLGDMTVLMTVQSDFNDVEWPTASQVHRLLGELEKRGADVHAISPHASNYSVIDGVPRVDTVFEFERLEDEQQETPLFKLYMRVDSDPGTLEELQEKDPLFLPLHYDETNIGIDPIDVWQTPFLNLISEMCLLSINTPRSEAWTLKHRTNDLIRKTGIPFIPTSHFQNELQLREYIQANGKVVGKPYNRAQGRDVYLFDRGNQSSDSLIHRISRDSRYYSESVFQPYVEIEEERQVYFIDGQPVGLVIKRGGDPWGNRTREEEAGTLTDDEIEYTKRLTEYTGLRVGRLDFAQLAKPFRGKDKYALEANGVGSGQIYWKQGTDGESDELIADYTEELVDYFINCYYTARKSQLQCKPFLIR